MAKITDAPVIHPRTLKHHVIETDDAEWEVSTVRLVRDVPEDIGEAFLMLRDGIDGITEMYETMIFKIVDERRYANRGIGASSFGHYRSNDSQDIAKAHDQIVSLIANGNLIPTFTEDGDHGASVAPCVLEAMMKEEKRLERVLERSSKVNEPGSEESYPPSEM